MGQCLNSALVNPRHPFLLFFLLKYQFISQHIIKYFVHECMKLAICEIMTRICENLKFLLARKWISLYMASVNDHWCSLCQKCDVQPLFKCLSFTKVNVHWYSHGCTIIGLSDAFAILGRWRGQAYTRRFIAYCARGSTKVRPCGLRALSLGTPHFAAAGL